MTYAPILLALAASLTQGSPRVDADASKSMDQMLTAYLQLKSYSCEVRTMATTVIVSYQRPNRIAVSVKDGKVNPALLNPISSVVSDGEFVYSVSPKHPLSYVKKPLTDPASLLDTAFQPTLQGGFIRLLLRGEDPIRAFMASGTKVRLAALSAGGEGTSDGTRTELVIAAFVDDAHGQKSNVIFEIGKMDHLLRKISIRDDVATASQVLPLETYRAVQADPAIPPTTFQFVPAKDAVAVQSFESNVSPDLKIGGKPFALGSDLKRHSITWNSLHGKVVLLDFWATWCMPCVSELPHLADLRRANFQSGFEVVSVATNVSETHEQVASFVAKKGLSWPQIYDGSGVIVKRFGISIYPTTLLIGRDGRIVGINLTADDLKKAIKAALVAPNNH